MPRQVASSTLLAPQVTNEITPPSPYTLENAWIGTNHLQHGLLVYLQFLHIVIPAVLSLTEMSPVVALSELP